MPLVGTLISLPRHPQGAMHFSWNEHPFSLLAFNRARGRNLGPALVTSPAAVTAEAGAAGSAGTVQVGEAGLAGGGAAAARPHARPAAARSR